MRRIAPLLWIALACSFPASATTVRRLPLAELARGAESIAHATIVDSRVEAEPNGFLWTVYTAELHEDFREDDARAGTTFEFRQMGGVLEDVELVAVGFPHFTVGEEAVLFLAGDGASLRILNAWQGAVRVSVTPSLSGGPPERRVPAVRGQFPESRAVELAELAGEIRAALDGARP